ncbi:MAG TPA: ABC transporter permease [Xanthobacteraceae bacterium]|nr:ABC transporter permease [Xanthobacteraceae bacterium]
MSKALQRLNLPGLAVMALCAGLWELYCRTLGAHFGSIASTSATVVALRDLLFDGPLAEQLWHTASVATVGWIIASALGFVFGLFLGLSRMAWTYSMASIEVLRSIPSISFVSIAVLLFGFSAKTEMVIVVYVSLWPMLLGTLGGIRAAPAGLLEVARIFRLSSAATFFKIILPAALPVILVGLRLSLTLSIALTVVAEMIGNPEGLGFGIVSSQQAMQPAAAFAYLLVIGVMGWGLNAAFGLATRRFAFAHERLS